MTTALIVVGVIAFLAIDVYVFRKVLTRHRSADDHGEIAVPGETQLTLPAGKISLTYQESQHTASGSEHDIDFDPPGDLVVTVSGSGGETLPVKGPGIAGMGSSKSTGIGFSRVKLGTVELPAAGDYTVKAESAQTAGLNDPKVLIGT